MIHLDANYLILANQAGSPEELHIQAWLRGHQQLAASSIAWMEFVTGPTSPDAIESIRQVLDERVITFGREEAELSAELFNRTGRKRGLRYDCMIAAAAMISDASLATRNAADFSVFIPHGLRLAT